MADERRDQNANAEGPGELSRREFVAISIGAGEIENVVRILFKEREIVAHGLGQVLLDHLRILPAPFSIQVCIAHDIQRRLFRKIRPCRYYWLRPVTGSAGA